MPLTPKKTTQLTTTQISNSRDAYKASLIALENLPGEHKVAVGLSGGVDSSLTAALLLQAGWEVDGLTLWLMSGKGSC